MSEVKKTHEGVLHLPCDVGEVSDGYHTFNELYEHRRMLFIALANEYPEYCWKSEHHNDGTFMEGWFIAGMRLSTGKDITYHLPKEDWELLTCKELDKAPPWDGHTAQDVADRLREWIKAWIALP